MTGRVDKRRTTIGGGQEEDYRTGSGKRRTTGRDQRCKGELSSVFGKGGRVENWSRKTRRTTDMKIQHDLQIMEIHVVLSLLRPERDYFVYESFYL